MIPFLRHIAHTFCKEVDSIELEEYCFVFPNRRGGSFLKKYFLEECKSSQILPYITTITDLMSSITDTVEASRIELLFTLYQEYSASVSEAVDFDQFIFWGDMVLNDFNDVDKYLADAKQLFTNVKDIKEINSNYLTEEQIAVLKEFFRDFETPDSYIDTFWGHSNSDSHDGDINNSFIKQRFFKLWEILYPLYRTFRKTLLNKGLSYSGMTYRNAVDTIQKLAKDDFEYKKYVFVGFNALSTSEYQIFKLLNDKGIADFYWDFNSPSFNDKFNKASRFVKTYKDTFKSKYDIGEADITTFPQIEVIALPSNVGQTKHAAEIVDRLVESGDIKDVENAIDTAIVLPDEELFLPMLSSLSRNINNINITMGLPMKHTAIVTLMSAISLMHSRARKVKDEYLYFHEDVSSVLSSPYIKAISAVYAKEVKEYINLKKVFYVPSSFLSNKSNEYSCVFAPVTDLNQKGEVISYVRNLLALIEKLIIERDEKSIELGFIAQYYSTLNQLSNSIESFDISMKENTFFFLLERLLSTTTISFEGEPLNGLQIMGVLETRSLDFDNVILLSMNERIFPRKHFSHTFIPNNLRKGFGLATTDYQDSIYAYYFYRLLSRAKKVFLLYDSRTQAMSSGEPSRYIYQLKHLYKDRIDIIFKNGKFDINTSHDGDIEVIKSENVMQKLNRYRDADSGKYLSASAINSYIDCPLKFYLDKVEGIRVEDEISEFIDSKTFGTIIHEVMRELYMSVPANKEGRRTITVDTFRNFNIQNSITRTVNKEYLKKGNNCNDTLTGENILIGDIIKYYVDAILQYDKNICNFTFEQGEEKETLYWKITDDISINFVQYIDRVDTVDDGLINTLRRIVDYKSGNDSSGFTSVNQLFENISERRSAILQLMLYCNVYSIIHNFDAPIQPLLYNFKAIKNQNEFYIKYGKNKLIDYHEINDEFMAFFSQIIKEMFDVNVPFRQTCNPKICDYCNFTDFCRR
ncbi:MAG: PD-(D/E)XK nuclease family protein [Muribaculaceae bacterium]